MTKLSNRVCNPIRLDKLANRRRPTNLVRTSATEHSTTFDKDRRHNFMKRGLCFNCGEHGHLCRDCPTKPVIANGVRNQPRLCFNCGGHDHLCKDCPKKPVMSNDVGNQRILCFNCGEPGHLIKDCPKNSEVTNDEKIQTSKALASLKTSTDEADSKCSMIVPVYISSSEDPDNEYLIYALLDTQSDTTFILNDICSMINSQYGTTRLDITTLNSSSTTTYAKKYRNLQIRGMYSSEVISLPTTYSTSQLPSNRQHIPTAEIARKWPHLENLEIPPMLNCRVGLLIGYDCPRAFAPIKVVRGTSDEPFALKTELGWSIVGLTHNKHDKEDELTKTVHRTRTTEDTFPQILIENLIR